MKVSPWPILAALLVAAFILALRLAPEAAGWSRGGQAGSVFGMMFGDGRQLLANQFFTMADVYFHSGYYPSIFDKGSDGQKEIISASHGHKETEEEEKNEDFLGRPKDWIEAFGRNFKITRHTHLENNNEREILPWLRLAADLDPHKLDTYTVGAFFLREHLGRPDQAEAFLREGLRNNPDSYEILFELGRIYHESGHDPDRARNVWLLGAKKFHALPEDRQQEDKLAYEAIIVNLARLEADSGHYADAIRWFEEAQTMSPNPGGLQLQIDETRKKMAAAPAKTQ